MSKKKTKATDDDTFYAQWSAKRTFCAACGIPAERATWPGLSTHHIVKYKRADEATNLLRLCDQCHRLAEGASIRCGKELIPKLTLAICLSIKKLREPEEFDPERLRELFGRNLPDLAPIPSLFRRDFCAWRHSYLCTEAACLAE